VVLNQVNLSDKEYSESYPNYASVLVAENGAKRA